jgi:hypothetical protein
MPDPLHSTDEEWYFVPGVSTRGRLIVVACAESEESELESQAHEEPPGAKVMTIDPYLQALFPTSEGVTDALRGLANHREASRFAQAQKAFGLTERYT